MNKRRGASLLSVMVFLLFAVMITAQVFFFAKSSVDSVAEQREIMMYRMNLDSLIKEPETFIKNFTAGLGGSANYSNFHSLTAIFNDNSLGNEWKTDGKTDPYHIMVYDLDYDFNASPFVRQDYIDNYGNSDADKKVFAAMPSDKNPDTDDIMARYYLIRAWVELPSNYYGRKLMYQVLVKRDETVSPRKLKTLSFQEVWF